MTIFYMRLYPLRKGAPFYQRLIFCVIVKMEILLRLNVWLILLIFILFVLLLFILHLVMKMHILQNGCIR